ncbi:MAG: SGNH/GDSL hydrolase family protein [Muribaculaceae bacterium]|nr:SGNH/GDSL hydrolase family protein [Muribaculaceae bacterium]
MKDSYKGTWWVLAIAFLLLFAVSAADGKVSLFGYTPKPSGLYQRLLGDNRLLSAQSGTSVSEPVVPEPPVARDTVAEPDTLPKTILLFGDSMLEGLSPRLAAYCKASGHTLCSVIWYSSTSERWGNSPRLSEYIKRLHPDYIFISLGANELFVSNIIEKRTASVRRILSDIGDIPYVWIGPPNWKEDTGVNRMIADNVKPGCFFLTNGMHFQRKKDGAHPTASSAREWMDSVVRWMPEHCAHPILMRTPQENSARPARVFIHQPNE